MIMILTIILRMGMVMQRINAHSLFFIRTSKIGLLAFWHLYHVDDEYDNRYDGINININDYIDDEDDHTE